MLRPRLMYAARYSPNTALLISKNYVGKIPSELIWYIYETVVFAC